MQLMIEHIRISLPKVRRGSFSIQDAPLSELSSNLEDEYLEILIQNDKCFFCYSILQWNQNDPF